MNSKQRDKEIVKAIKETADATELYNSIARIVDTEFHCERPSVHSMLEGLSTTLAATRRVLDPAAWVTKLLERAGVNPVEIIPEPVVEEVVEEVAPAKAEKKSKRPYLALAELCLKAGKHNKEELIGTIMVAFPQMNRVTIDTFIIDLRNPKYTAFKNRTVVRDDEGRLRFAN